MSRSGFDARKKIEIMKAANTVLRKLSTDGSSVPSAGPRIRPNYNLLKPSVKGRIGIPVSKFGNRATGNIKKINERNSLSSRLGYHQKFPRNNTPRATNEFQNFTITADVDDNDNSVIIQPATNRQNRFNINERRPVRLSTNRNLSLSRTISNPNAPRTAALPSRKERFRQEVVNKKRFTGKRGGIGNAAVFMNALQDVERSREESNEIIGVNNRPVFERLSFSTQKSNVGYVVRVTNLSPTVTDEDVEELFSSIGPLVSSKLIRAGVGQAVFVRLQDAKNAIKEFNNRELDGVAMKCNLVNEINTTTEMTTKQQRPNKFRARIQAPNNNNMPLEESEEMEIDRNLFTQAMFGQKEAPKNVNSASSSVQFTVKI